MDDLFKGRHFDREIIILCVRWYLRFKLSFRDLVEMMAERGLSLAHTTIMRWIRRYVPEFEKRWNRFACRSWRILAGRRNLREGQRHAGLISTVLSTSRKDGRFPAPRQARCRSRQSVFPAGVQEPGPTATKDHARRLSGFASSGAGIPWAASGGARTKIRSSKYLNNLIEQDHRSIKLRLGPMLGLKRFRSASITIAGIELMHRIRKGQFKLGRLRIKDKTGARNLERRSRCMKPS